MAVFSILRGFIQGMYFSLDLVLGLVLCILYARHKHVGRIIPALLMGGCAMLADSVSVGLHFFQSLVVSQSPFIDYAYPCLDLLVTSVFFFSGLSLFTAQFPSFNAVRRVSLSAIAMLLFFFVTSNKVVFSILTLLWLVLMFGILVRRIRQYHNSLVFYYSDVNSHRGVWFLLVLLWSFAIYPLYKLSFMGVAYADLCYVLYAILSMLMYSFLSYYLSTQTIDSKIAPISVDCMPAKDGLVGEADLHTRITIDTLLSDSQQRAMADRLTALMKDDKMYRNSDLCVDDLVSQLATNSSYFYYFMRDVMKVSFFDYVNGYRVDEAKGMLLSGEKIDIVAGKVGFNSANSFRRAFKRTTGISPSEWRASQE